MKLDKFVALSIVAMLATLAAVAYGQTATSSAAPAASDFPALIEMMAQAFKGGAWGLGAGLLLTVVVAAADMLNLLKRVPKAAKKWVAMGLAMATAIGVGLTSGTAWMDIVVTAVTTGLTAVGGWEAVFEPIRDKIRGSKPEVELPSE